MTNAMQAHAMRKQMGMAEAYTDADQLLVSTGLAERRWRWTGQGLATTGLRDLRSGREWVRGEPEALCDWSNEELLGSDAQGELISITARESDDEGFTSRHLEVRVEVAYPSQQITVHYVIWAYPGAPGIRTQLWVQGHPRHSQSDRAAKGPIIRLAKGAARTAARPAQEAGAGPASVLADRKEVVLQAMGLRAGRRYTMGIGWPEEEADGSRQVVILATVDGEYAIEAVPEQVSQPASRGIGPAASTAALFDLPDSVRPDGMAAVRIQNRQGTRAVIRDVWLYEHAEEDSPAGSWPDADPQRIAELMEAAPAGTRLTAYLNGQVHRTEESLTSRSDSRVDYLPVSAADGRRAAMGYYNDTQNRNTAATPVIREADVAEAVVDWASVLYLENGDGGLVMVKESHKCVNQNGVDTGHYRIDASGIHNTGWGLAGSDLAAGTYKWCWASWVILHEGGDVRREQALKQFDRMRYPVKAERDMWSVVCTWGHSKNPRDGRNYAAEQEVLHEMDVVADLGMDMLLIDDGWQVSPAAASWKPDGGIGWKPHPAIYPQGWDRIVERRRQTGVRLGLWGVAQDTPVEDMIWNWERLGMEQIKLDFATLGQYQALDELAGHVRKFMLATERRCIISWDTTENNPRYGYYWAREYGNVHFLNRKPEHPASVVYVPWLALRDFWQLARYQNLNKWQLTIQNPEVVHRDLSDAYLHSASYCIATAFMGIPEFMAVPRYYSEQAREEIRPLLQLYKEHQRAIFDSFVFPIGEEPTNGSWSGFQAWREEARGGHLTIFRERLNEDAAQVIALRFVQQGDKLRIANLREGTAQTVEVGEGGRVRFEIAQPGDFLFLKYELAETGV